MRDNLKLLYKRLSNPYLLLFCLSFAQAFIFLRTDQNIGLKIFAGYSGFCFYLLSEQLSIKLLRISLIIGLLFSIFIYPSLHVYGFPDKNLIANILYTNKGEVWFYLKIVPLTDYITLLVLTSYTTFLIFRKFDRKPNQQLTLISILILLAPVIIYFIRPAQSPYLNYDKTQVNLSYLKIPVIKIPVLIAIEGYQVIESNKKILKEAKKPDDWNVLNKNIFKLRRNIVIVIGESVRRDFLSCYGFPIETTPFVDNTPHIQFDNFISAGAFTVPSLTRTLVYSNSFSNFALSDNIVNLAKKAGYETYWLSNQGYIGIFDSPITTIAGASDHYLKFNGGDFHITKMDSVMLPYISQIIKKDSTPKVIFVHMIGNHPDIRDRTNGRYDQFIISNDFSYYVQAIKNTDTFLSKIYYDLKETNKEFGLIYFSDHGLIYRYKTKDFPHGYSFKTSYEVPLLIWGNDINKSKKYKVYRNSRDFIDLFCQLYDIKASNLKPQPSFISSEKFNDSVFDIIGEQDEIQDFRNLKENPLPSLN